MEVATEAGRHYMAQMGKEGDIKTIWDPANPDEVVAARKQFKGWLKKGGTAFSVDEGGDKGNQMHEFDPNARRVILVPQIAGG
jgi:hypothetical protein